ncbi:MAG: hypothetical protein PHF46_04110 [Candidatus Gracilibacteria bacterium]|nr:hypothetical protein [Candidatus Gracilibacteria bacterium]MDD3120567.1 hypothetical protein [Candidatus Gracilibacteria bacterium]
MKDKIPNRIVIIKNEYLQIRTYKKEKTIKTKKYEKEKTVKFEFINVKTL